MPSLTRNKKLMNHFTRVFYFTVIGFLLLISTSCHSSKAFVLENVSIDINTYSEGNEIKATAMPSISESIEILGYSRRFEYLLINVPTIHSIDNAQKRNKLFELYPNTLELRKRYLNELIKDKNLKRYIDETLQPIRGKSFKTHNSYSVDELMEVASKFFYCDKVFPDTSIQAHVCIGLNGIKEAEWKNDYTLLEAFCYEAIFADLDKDTSLVWDSFGFQKNESCFRYRENITTLHAYLQDVKLDLFERMKADPILKRALLDYYTINQSYLAFTLIF